MIKKPTRIDYTKLFDKNLKKSPLEIKIAFRKKLALFLLDPYIPQLNNHALTGSYKGYRSINITGDWRALYSQRRDGDISIILFEILGTHAQLYK